MQIEKALINDRFRSYHTPVEGDKIFTRDAKYAKHLNVFFSNQVKNPKIPELKEVKPFSEKHHIRY